MNLRHTLHASLVLAALAVAGSAAFGAEAASGSKEQSAADNGASIPFANRGGIRDWRADRDRGLWVQDVHGKWYYATLMGPCTGLNFANTIAFDTSPMGTFDRFSAIVVPRGNRCTVQSFAPSGAPPGKKQAVKAVEEKPKS